MGWLEFVAEYCIGGNCAIAKPDKSVKSSECLWERGMFLFFFLVFFFWFFFTKGG
jgi:hypothetical protein